MGPTPPPPLTAPQATCVPRAATVQLAAQGVGTLYIDQYKLIIIISPLLFIFNFTILLSPLGSYCPQGTFGNTTGLRSANECIACEPGYYCPTQGHIKPYDQCNAGYYCSGGSIEANPVAKTYGYVCPVGHYCPKGTPILVPCPKGTYQPGTGRAEMFIYWFIKLHDQMSEC